MSIAGERDSGVADPRTRTGTAQGGRRGKPASIMPEKAVTGRTLTLAMALMCFLACIALAGVLVISRAVTLWSTDISQEVTVQIRPADGEDIDRQIVSAVAILEATEGVAGVRVLGRDRAVALLEPWLGKGAVLDQLPIPRLVAVEIDTEDPPDLAALGEALETQVPGATLDTHRQWQAQLARTAGTLSLVGYGVLALISMTAMVIIAFATRAAIDANRTVVEVLHLVGASDRFVAGQVQWHFLKLGLRAGIAGTAVGVAALALLALLGTSDVPGGLTEATRALIFGPVDLTATSYLLFLLVPVVATLISLITARFTVMRILNDVY